MKVAGIIAEYNPFHNGHKYLIDESKRITGATHIVSVMSGDFVMRGEPACFNKLIRAEAAVRGGCDLVIELPLCFSLSSAENFALGGVSVLDSLGIVDNISFGSECGDIDLLWKAAERLSGNNVSEEIKKEMKNGIPIFEAISRLVPSMAEVLSAPNNILAVNYLKALKKLGSDIVPVTVKRNSVSHDGEEITGNFASALALRKKLASGEEIKQWTPSDLFTHGSFVSEKSFDMAVTYALRSASKSEIKKVKDVGEGLENLIFSEARKNYGANEIAAAVKSKRYAYTRIKRIIYNLFLGIEGEFSDKPPRYARVLAFNDKGRELINEIKKRGRIPLITNITEKTFEMFPEMLGEVKAAHIYALGEKEKICGGELLCKYIKKGE